MGSPEEISIRNDIQGSRRTRSKGGGHQRISQERSGGSEAACYEFMDNLPDAIQRVDREYRHIYGNAAFAHMLGVAVPEVVGKTSRELGVAEPIAALWEAQMRGVFESGRTLAFETALPSPGGLCLFESRVIPEHDPGGNVIAVTGVHRDVTERKRLEEAVRDSEERLQFAQRVGSMGTFDWNLRTGMTVWTPELEDLHGLPRGSFGGTQAHWEALLHPDDRDDVLRHLKHSFDADGPVEGEWRVIQPHGDVRWLASRWQVLRNALGEPLRVRGVNIDITDRKRLEEELRRSEERFRMAVAATNDAIWDLDLVTGVLSWNETLSTLYGSIPATADPWQWWIERIHPEDREQTVEGLRAAIGSGASSWTSEYRFRRSDGGWSHVYDRACIARDPAGRARRLVGAMQDLTDRRQAAAALAEIDLHYKFVFESISVCLFLIDATHDGRFRYVAFNPAEEQVVGLSNSQIAGRFVEDVFEPALAAKLTANYRDCVAAGRAIQYDDELHLPAGRRYFHSNLIPLRNAHGEINRIIGACIDITDFRRTQEEALARQNLESLGVLAGGIAHDFNNVLGGINAQAELIEFELPATSELKQEIQRIKTAAMRGSEIVRGLMVYAGQDQSHCAEAVDVSRLVEEMLGLLKVSISKHAVLRTNLAQDLPPISGNAPQVRQVVMNLVINASEAIGDTDGVITLSTAYVDGADSYVRLEVSDTGHGIGEETKARVFDPFFSTKFAGRGMGLAVVRRIVQDHGGTIQVVSAPLQGATFQVLLPCPPARPSPARGTVAVNGEEARNTGTGTILVVEDEDLLRAAISKSLRKFGFSVIAASDGTDAMEQIRAQGGNLHAVLLDVTLPGASSRQILEEARRIRSDLRVVVTSAYSKETVDASFAGLPLPQFIRKPFMVSEIVRLLKEPAS
jgi:PAS domain S-box-containing protein